MYYKLVNTAFIEQYFPGILEEINKNRTALLNIDNSLFFKNKQKALMRPYIEKRCPDIFQLYKNNNLIKELSRLVNQKLVTCDPSMVRSCEVILSDSPDSQIDNHKDYNVYNGTRYTCLIILKSTNGQTLCMNNTDCFKYRKNFAVIFDDDTYHKVSEPTQQGERITLSFSYTTDPSINWTKYLTRFPQTILYKYYSCLNFENRLKKTVLLSLSTLLVLFLLWKALSYKYRKTVYAIQ